MIAVQFAHVDGVASAAASPGLLAVMAGGSIAEWDRTLTVAEPVLESVIIGG